MLQNTHELRELVTGQQIEAEVVGTHPYYRQRCVLEAWHIRTEHYPGLGRNV